MNCKQGDLAIVVRSVAGNEGMIVTCIRPYNGPWAQEDYLPGWEIDRDVRSADGSSSPYIPDRLLRPIRPSEGQDETLSWKDVPQGEYA